MVTWETLLLVARIGVFALWLWLHLGLLVRTLRAPQLPWLLRLAALIPVLLPVLAARTGSRLRVGLWLLAVLVYAGLYALSWMTA